MNHDIKWKPDFYDKDGNPRFLKLTRLPREQFAEQLKYYSNICASLDTREAILQESDYFSKL